MVGERGFEPPTPWSRTKCKSKSQCFIWCRLGTKNRTFSHLQMYQGYTEIALTMPRRLGERGGEDLYAAGPLLARQLGASSSKDLAWLSRKSIIFPTISMESFEDSPDANRHGGTSIPRELVAKEWRSRLLHPRTHLFLCELRKSRPKGQQRSESIVPKP